MSSKSKALAHEPAVAAWQHARTDAIAEEQSADQHHPLEDLQATIGNQAVLRLSPQTLRRVQRKGATAAQPLTEAQARTELQTHWGVQRVEAGTAADQEQHMRNNSMQYFGSPTPPSDLATLLSNAGWSAWKPASSASLWGDLVRAFADLAKAFGGVPPVKEVLFFKTDFIYDPAAPGGPALKASNKSLADFGAGQYAIFEAATYQGTLMPLATGKSVSGSAAPVGSRPVPFTLVHELGHGIVEAVLNNINPAMIKDYQAEVGWYGGRLYDVGVQAVRDAIKNKTTPDAQYEITRANWDSATWQEQPISLYSLDGPSEDFPEAVAAYVREPAMLKARSPRRHDFIAKLASTLVQQGSASPLRARTP